MTKSHAPKVILITGASSGFGMACVDYLTERGHRVYGTSRTANFPTGQISPNLPLTIPMDVRDHESVKRAVEFVLEREGRLDVLVNNAGFALAGAIENTSTEEAMRQFDTNFFGVHRVCRKVLPAMRGRRSGLIVNISSLGGLITVPFQGFYCASKYALEALTESLRMEVKPYGVQVTLIEPGDFKTSITTNRVVAEASSDASDYAERQRSAVEVIANDEQRGADPRELAFLLGNIIDRQRVRTRYLVGMHFQKLAVWVKRVLPASVFEALIMGHYKI
jgi:NAD(P)-dependent dehydrogenase (short-subunit alcohol dehydrogenase family)